MKTSVKSVTMSGRSSNKQTKMLSELEAAIRQEEISVRQVYFFLPHEQIRAKVLTKLKIPHVCDKILYENLGSQFQIPTKRSSMVEVSTNIVQRKFFKTKRLRSAVHQSSVNSKKFLRSAIANGFLHALHSTGVSSRITKASDPFKGSESISKSPSGHQKRPEIPPMMRARNSALPLRRVVSTSKSSQPKRKSRITSHDKENIPLNYQKKNIKENATYQKTSQTSGKDGGGKTPLVDHLTRVQLIPPVIASPPPPRYVSPPPPNGQVQKGQKRRLSSPPPFHGILKFKQTPLAKECEEEPVVHWSVNDPYYERSSDSELPVELSEGREDDSGDDLSTLQAGGRSSKETPLNFPSTGDVAVLPETSLQLVSDNAVSACALDNEIRAAQPLLTSTLPMMMSDDELSNYSPSLDQRCGDDEDVPTDRSVPYAPGKVDDLDCGPGIQVSSRRASSWVFRHPHESGMLTLTRSLHQTLSISYDNNRPSRTPHDLLRLVPTDVDPEDSFDSSLSTLLLTSEQSGESLTEAPLASGTLRCSAPLVPTFMCEPGPEEKASARYKVSVGNACTPELPHPPPANSIRRRLLFTGGDPGMDSSPSPLNYKQSVAAYYCDDESDELPLLSPLSGISAGSGVSQQKMSCSVSFDSFQDLLLPSCSEEPPSPQLGSTSSRITSRAPQRLSPTDRRKRYLSARSSSSSFKTATITPFLADDVTADSIDHRNLNSSDSLEAPFFMDEPSSERSHASSSDQNNSKVLTLFSNCD